MNNKSHKYVALVLTFILIMSVCIFWCAEKSGMFIDEIYTYGLSNSSYAPFIQNVKDGDMIDKQFKRAEFFNYLTVTSDENKFDFASVYYNQTKDVHPPLYYWLINIASSLFPNMFSKWIGLGLNLLLYFMTLVVLYNLCNKLFKSKLISIMCLLMYGLSTVGISTVLMIRMYILSTLLTVLLAYVIVELFDKNTKILFGFASLIIFLGMLTHYYFVFYAFFACVL